MLLPLDDRSAPHAIELHSVVKNVKISTIFGWKGDLSVESITFALSRREKSVDRFCPFNNTKL